MRAHRHWQRHLDVVFVKINGMTHSLSRAVDPTVLPCRSLVVAMIETGGAGSTTGQGIHTCRSDDGSGQYCGSGACTSYRSSLQFMPRSTTTFQRSATS